MRTYLTVWDTSITIEYVICFIFFISLHVYQAFLFHRWQQTRGLLCIAIHTEKISFSYLHTFASRGSIKRYGFYICSVIFQKLNASCDARYLAQAISNMSPHYLRWLWSFRWSIFDLLLRILLLSSNSSILYIFVFFIEIIYRTKNLKLVSI